MPPCESVRSASAGNLRTHGWRAFGFAQNRLWAAFFRRFAAWSVSGFQQCFVAMGSRGPDTSAVMLAAAVTTGVTSATVRVSPAEMLPAAVKTLRRAPAAFHMPAASSVEAA